MHRLFLLLLLFAILPLLGGCGEQGDVALAKQTEKLARKPVDPHQLNIGYLKNSVLSALKKKGNLEKRLSSLSIRVKWKEFTDQASLFEAIQEGTVDFGSVGDSVPAFLRNDQVSLIYLAAEPANPQAHAIVVRPDSGITKETDLKGKTIAYESFTNEHYLLMQVLERNGLSLKDVKSIALEGNRLPQSFAGRQTDAWVVPEPEQSRLEPYGLRIIADGTGLNGNRDIYVTTAESLKGRKECFDLVLQEVSLLDEWITNQVHDAAELLTDLTEVNHIEWLNMFDHKSHGTAPFLDSIVQEEQSIVDALTKRNVRKHGYEIDIGVNL